MLIEMLSFGVLEWESVLGLECRNCHLWALGMSLKPTLKPHRDFGQLIDLVNGLEWHQKNKLFRLEE